MTATEMRDTQAIRLKTSRGALTLTLLLLVQFLDFLDVSIVNVALPSIKHDLGFSTQNLQWIVSGYVLTYGGFLLLGGRAADLIGRRRVLLGGLSLFALASLAGRLRANRSCPDRRPPRPGRRRGTDGAGGPLDPDNHLHPPARAQRGARRLGGRPRAGRRLRRHAQRRPHRGAGWRWIFYLNVPVAVLAALGALLLIAATPAAGAVGSFDLRGAMLVTGGMLLFIYTLVRAPDVGWGNTTTIAGTSWLRSSLLAAFVANERRARNPLVPFSIFRIKGLAAANATQLISFGGLYAMFFFLSLYMQNVLGYSPIHTGLAYLPVTGGFMIAVADRHAADAADRHQAGHRRRRARSAAAGIYYLSHVPVDGTFLSRPAAGNRRRRDRSSAPSSPASPPPPPTASPPTRPASPPGLLNASMQFGGALGLAVLSAVATDRTNSVLASGGGSPLALTAGFQRAFLVGTGFVLAAAAIAATAANRRPGNSSVGATP